MSIIDIHFHGTEKIDIKEVKDSEEILFMARHYGEKGIDGFLVTLYPDDLNKMRRSLSIIKEAINNQTEGAKIHGVYLEGPFINPEQSGALDYTKFLTPDIDKLKKLIEGFEAIIKIITIAPELPGALRLIERCVVLGILVSMGHSNATFKEAQEGFMAGAKLITHLFNAMRGIHHREPGLAGFGVINEEVFIELIADGRHINDEILKWLFNIKRTDRIILISDMVKDKGDERLIKGSSMNLLEIKERVLQLKIDSEKINKAIYENPKKLLGI
jgi:N-acetylglucosamine-6-phosphate deacetylase